jgi:BirA family transcriptional regulator, biotin operon repressor / biotin---[acetyl-CoA-carboxylase] ligase
VPAFVSRLERFERVDSTQSVVRRWLEEGSAEVCVAMADAQDQGRGRLDRSWQDRPSSSLLVSAGFRPAGISAVHAWRLPAIASMAMLEAATSLLGPTKDRLALKWPNDIVALHHGRLLKVAGVLTESALEGDHLSTAVVGVGVNVDWPKGDYPQDLATTMWSLSEASGRRRIDREALLRAWLGRLGPLYEELQAGRFDGLRWADSQITTGSAVEVETGSGSVSGTAVGVDSEGGALLVRTGPGQPISTIAVGDVVHCLVADAASAV